MWERVRWRTQSKGMLEDAFETADRHPPARPQPHHTHCNILHTLGHITPSRLSLPPHHKPRSRPGRFLPQQPVCTAYPGKSCLLHHLKKLLRRIDPLMNLFRMNPSSSRMSHSSTCAVPGSIARNPFTILRISTIFFFLTCLHMDFQRHASCMSRADLKLEVFPIQFP